MTPITIRQLSKHFGSTVAVDAIDLTIPAGDLFFLLGPSGCGKTTLLRMLAGFTEPTQGTIHFGDADVTHAPANKRNTGMVFQGYALWPHMTVRQNVRFGLEVRKVSKPEMKKRVDEALASVQLGKLADRKINQLSGGQQQRVALARALVIRPTVLLLDEPLSNLDAKLRLEMRQSIRDICKDSGITGVYVTHDQHEALSMADNIAVLKDGRVCQSGPPGELYRRPDSRFVADFLGETNFLPAEVKGTEGDHIILTTPFGDIRSSAFPDNLPQGGAVTCSLRPEAIQLLDPETATGGIPNNTFTAKWERQIYLGSLAQHRLILADHRIKAVELNPRPRKAPSPSDQVHFHIDPADVVILRD
ncbi:MAG: ABC transporter ATP-binding protein [Phycisphaerales bacterium JB063]